MKWSWNTSAIVCVLIAALGMVFAIGQLRSRQRALHDSISRRDTTVASIREYQSLSNAQQDTIHGTKPQQDVEAKIALAIDYAKISPKPKFQVRVQEDREFRQTGSGNSGNQSGLREQEISIRIPNLSVQGIGQILVYWRDQQHIWTPKHIELIHDQRSKSNQYTLQLDCVAVYHGSGA